MRTGETGVLVDRLTPGRQCVETVEDERAPAVYRAAIEQAQAMRRTGVRDRAARQFDPDRIIVAVIADPQRARLGWSIAATARV